MSNLVIVAIPCEDDYVHNISSEKVPHCTLLFLGPIEGKPVLKIQQFLEHAVNLMEMGPFGLEVSHRGVLGEDEADVLFFRKDFYSFKRVAEFRAQLLKHTPIKTAYDSTEQFSGWTPHLTLGYPPTPAREDKRDYPGIRWVEFNRIALWYGDYEGPEFRLEYNYDLAEVAMSSVAEAGKEFLEHFGVKGMKWGVRSSRPAPAATSSQVKQIIPQSKNRATKLKSSGGENHPATQDAVKIAELRQKMQKSGTHALSNAELREVSDRLNLEVNVSRLSAQRPTSAGRQLVRKLTQDPFRTADAGSQFVREVNTLVKETKKK